MTAGKMAPDSRGGVIGGVDWSRWSVILLKPDCIRHGLTDTVLNRLSAVADICGRTDVTVADWQIFVHYWDLLVDADWFDINIPESLRSMYVGQQVTVALAHGPVDTPQLLRQQLGHFDPSMAAEGTIRGDLGTDSLISARSQGRLVENLVHTSDDACAARRDFGTWYGADRHQLLIHSKRLPATRIPNRTRS